MDDILKKDNDYVWKELICMIMSDKETRLGLSLIILYWPSHIRRGDNMWTQSLEMHKKNLKIGQT